MVPPERRLPAATFFLSEAVLTIRSLGMGAVLAALGIWLAGAPLGAAPEGPALPEVRLRVVAEGLTAPLLLTAPDDGSGRRYVVDQPGVIRVLDGEDRLREEPFLDLRERVVPLRKAFDERGLLGLAFHPDFAANRRFYVTYTAPRRADSPYTGQTAYTRRVSAFTAADGLRADPDSERVLLAVDWPNRKHNGGGLAFGPHDGFLYIGLGDGGGAHGLPDVQFDAFEVPPGFHRYDAWAQDPERLYGKILRVDVDGGEPYAVPPGNPFRGRAAGRDEIYAWGFRNPFRITFDPAGGAMVVSGVGETFWETVYLVDGPGNYGWAIREGRHCFDRARPFDPPASCPRTGPLGERIHDPVVEYLNAAVNRPQATVTGEARGTASVGGYIYRGEALPALRGLLVFGDFSADWMEPSGQLFVARPAERAGEPWSMRRLARLPARVHSLGRDAAGELYVLTTAKGLPVGHTGKVYRLEPAAE